jgi:hypothetical protein
MMRCKENSICVEVSAGVLTMSHGGVHEGICAKFNAIEIESIACVKTNNQIHYR